MKKNLILWAMLCLMMSGSIHAQLRTTSSYEINPQEEIKTTTDQNKTTRTIDNATVQLLRLNEKAAGNTPEEIALNFIKKNWSATKHRGATEDLLALIPSRSLNSGTIVSYGQTYKGLNVDKNAMILKLNNENTIRSFQNYTIPINIDLDITPKLNETRAVDVVKNHLGLTQNGYFEEMELMVHIVNFEPYLAWQVKFIPMDKLSDWEAYVDAQTGELLEILDVICNVNGTGQVFNPTPTYTAGVVYGTGNYTNANDATNADINNEMMNVTLNDIEDLGGGNFRLNGPYASVLGTAYDNTSTSFMYTRDQAGFEATMCYYYLDQSMRYINIDQGISVTPAEYTGGVRYNPHQPGSTNAFFFSGSGELEFGDGGGLGGDDVDSGEDGLIILHELGHGIHHWFTNENHSRKEGLSEGLSDYWGMSGTRDCADGDTYAEWEDGYHAVFNWGLQPAIDNLGLHRTTAFTGNYCANIGNQPNVHASGQWISTALMRIFSDLGKFKTDRLLLETMPLLVGPGTNGVNLQETGAFLYQTAIDLMYSASDICIIYNHLDDVLCISQPGTSVPAPAGGAGNVYMKDTECDNGTEVNPDSGPMWRSPDIWVRRDADNSLQHQSAEFKTLSPNHVYVRVRGIGCDPLQDASLRVYFSKASTGLSWQTHWDNYIIAGPNGPVLAGDEITSVAVPIPAIEPGEEVILDIPLWPPNPDDFFPDLNNPWQDHHFCLLARIESATDPMFMIETSGVSNNTRNNNNIAWKNVSVYDNDVNNIWGPISVYIGCEKFIKQSTLSVETAHNSLDRPAIRMGNIFMELTDPFKKQWEKAGRPGRGFKVVQEGLLLVTDEKFYIELENVKECDQTILMYYEPFNRNRPMIFDVVQRDTRGEVFGGERFEFDPNVQTKPRSTPQIAGILDNNVLLFPNPASEHIQMNVLKPNLGITEIRIVDVQGKVMHQQEVEATGAIERRNFDFDIAAYTPGLYIMIIKNAEGAVVETTKFIKE